MDPSKCEGCGARADQHEIGGEVWRFRHQPDCKAYPTYPSSSELVDAVNHPPHYKTGGIETIDFIEAKQLPYHLGNVVKYVTRAQHKGSELQDLEKAQWYLNRHIERLKAAGGAR